MRERARETKARGLRAADATIGTDAVLAKISTREGAGRQLVRLIQLLPETFRQVRKFRRPGFDQ